MSAPCLVAVFSSDALGGSELFNLEFLRTAGLRGVTTHAVVPGDGPLRDVLATLAASISTIAIPEELTSMSRFQSRIELAKLPRRMSSLAAYLPSLRSSLARLPGPVCAFGFRSQLAVSAAAARRRPCMWVVHEVVPPGAPATMWRAASRRASSIVTYSNAAASQRALRGRDVTVRAVRFDLFRYASAPKIETARTVGLVGDLVELKNHLFAVDVIKRLRSGGDDVSLLLIGRDVSRNVPRAAAYAERVRRAVADTPGVELVSSTPEEMPDMMARLDILLHASTVAESFGRVVVEAMAAARPVVAFAQGGVDELIDHGRTGYLCPPGDAECVVRALSALVSDSRLCADMGAAARRSTIERFEADPEQRDTVGDSLAEFAISRQ